MAGFEPTTSRLLSECSTAKLHRHFDFMMRALTYTQCAFKLCNMHELDANNNIPILGLEPRSLG